MKFVIPAKLIVKHQDTNNATILRGLAAASVVIVHYNGFGIRSLVNDQSSLSAFLNTFIYLGIYGPAVFFVASGFALSASLAKRRPKFSTFFVHRIFRLLPLYALILLLDLTYKYYNNGRITSLEFKNVLIHLTFLDVFNWRYLKSDPIGVLATIPIEFWWSLLIPALIIVRQSAKYLEIPILGILIFLTFFMENLGYFNSYLSEYGLNNCKRWWVYGICFYFGNIAYSARKTKIIRVSNSKFLATAACLSFTLELFRLNLLYTILAISFIYLVMGDTFKSPRKLAQWINNILLCAGTICYSIYLLHFPIKHACFAVFENDFFANSLCIILIVLLSCASYLFIEVPFIRFGKKITTSRVK
jgi:peptidoglycan/LPS O-acetylase OafA/YrhL